MTRLHAIEMYIIIIIIIKTTFFLSFLFLVQKGPVFLRQVEEIQVQAENRGFYFDNAPLILFSIYNLLA